MASSPMPKQLLYIDYIIIIGIGALGAAAIALARVDIQHVLKKE
jgi:tRNA A37 threonylcarbamoyladenosine dehydratase